RIVVPVLWPRTTPVLNSNIITTAIPRNHPFSAFLFSISNSFCRVFIGLFLLSAPAYPAFNKGREDYRWLEAALPHLIAKRTLPGLSSIVMTHWTDLESTFDQDLVENNTGEAIDLKNRRSPRPAFAHLEGEGHIFPRSEPRNVGCSGEDRSVPCNRRPRDL